MKDLKIKMNFIEEAPICSNFRIIMPEDKIESSMSNSKIGKFSTKKKETQINFNFRMKNSNKEPQISFVTTMENIIASSVQICIWKESRRVSENERVRTVVTKNQGSGVKVDDVQISIQSSEGDTPRSSSVNESQTISNSEDDDFQSSNEEESTPESEGDSESNSESSITANNIQNSRFKLLGECHIGFATILKTILEFINNRRNNALDGVNGTISVVTGKRVNAEIDLKDLQENNWDIKSHALWYFGRKIGEIDIKIEARNLPFIRQMVLGVLTGGGVRFSSKMTSVGDIRKKLGSK